MPVPPIILDLVERFAAHSDAYRSGQYNETQLRREFLDPLFGALGWDVNNAQGYAEAYKDVIHEDAIKVGGATKAPDYCFRIGGSRKFFVEAKKPSVNLKDDPSAAYQLRRYAWSAKLPLSILTDFEEFAVYDCRVKPSLSDNPAKSRTLYCTYTDYPARWDEIAAIFSRDSVLKGSFDKYAESTKAKKGTAEVDAAFLAEIESWRDLLARNIALRNPKLTQRELNFAVQRTIDRLIFLRIAEDRGVEEYATLRALLNGTNCYKRLRELYYSADHKYNSGLFHFEPEKGRNEAPDDLTPKLTIDDKPLKDIIRRLYYPESPYEFAVLPADILGQVYEQFLGKVIRLTGGHRAVVEDKPEVKKAGGVFYTPGYIVDYIVSHTLGAILNPESGQGETNVKDVAKLRVLDPACGSGSFLIAAYQFLLDWHHKTYLADGPEKHATGRNPKLYSTQGGWRLTTAERKRILLANIYGVDIDIQAVEVTKLSLLLKVLEGESGETLASQLKFLHERALPDLGDNIKWGNSLIGPEFYKQQELGLLGEADRYRVNVFDWKDQFPVVMSRGGFDVIVGNPPYIRIQALKEWAPLEVEYYKERYKSAGKGNYDIYVVFVERALSLLNKTGRLGFILPHKFFNAQYGEPLRQILADGHHLEHVVNFGDQQVFPGATTYTCLMFLGKAPSNEARIAKVDDLPAWRISEQADEGAVESTKITRAGWNFVVGRGSGLFERLRAMPVKLGDVAERIFQGIIPGADKVYSVEIIRHEGKVSLCYSRAAESEFRIESNLLRGIVSGPDVSRYVLHRSRMRVIYPYRVRGEAAELIPPATLKRDFPLAFDYFERTRELLARRDRGATKGPLWYSFVRDQNIALQPRPKIAIPRLVQRLQAGYDSEGAYCLDNVDVGGVILAPAFSHLNQYLLALLNSELMNFIFVQGSVPFRGGYYSANKQYVVNLPMKIPTLDSTPDAARHERVSALADQMVALHGQLLLAKTDHEKTALLRQIDATDKVIDGLVYELYGLSDEEIAVVEQMVR
ncbi:MAG: Eco57I restriction-modification methylase domain-containing protein [candidate division Zixibacteria bacterium]|nr:Eco57I restriction-modification methylase domain-containing protein [candidate division Zixibacteria bacterium]